MKKYLVTFIIFVIFLTGFSFGQVDAADLRFGLLPAEGSIPMIVAKEKGFFKKQGVEVELVTFNSPNLRNIAMQAGKIDGMIADVMTALSFQESGFEMVITSDINEDFKLLTSPQSGINSIKELADEEVALVPGFVLEYIMDEMAVINEIDYQALSVPSFVTRFEGIISGKITSVIFTEPQAAMLVAKGAKIIASSKEYNIKAGTMLFSKEFVDANQASLRGFYMAYNEAVKYINQTSASEYAGVLGNYGFPPAVEEYLSGDIKFEKAKIIPEETFNDVLRWTQEKGQIKDDYTFAEMTNYNYLK